MDKDLNINNYSLADTLALFDIPLHFSKSQYNSAHERYLKISNAYIKTNKELCKFYEKCYKIVDCIYHYRKDKNTTKYNENEENIVSFKIKSIEDFETKGPLELLNMISRPIPDSVDPSSYVLPGSGNVDKLTYVTSGNNMNGILNPLTIKNTSKILNIDSRFRKNYNTTQSTNFITSLPTSFNKVTQLKLLDFEMPTTYFIISNANKNNYFWLSVTTNNVTSGLDTITYYYIVISDGNYTTDSFKIHVNKIFIYLDISIRIGMDLDNNASGTGRSRIYVDDTFASSTDPITSFDIKFNGIQLDNTVTSSASTINIYEKINIDELSSGLGWMMGYRKESYINSNDYYSEGILDLSGYKYLYLAIEDYNNNVNDNFYSAMDEYILNTNIVARISLTGRFFTRISENYTITSMPREYFGPVTINKLHIQLLNEYGKVINLNDMDYSFTLKLTTLYEK